MTGLRKDEPGYDVNSEFLPRPVEHAAHFEADDKDAEKDAKGSDD